MNRLHRLVKCWKRPRNQRRRLPVWQSYWMLPESGEEAPAVAGCRPLLFDRSTDLQQWLVQGYVE